MIYAFIRGFIGEFGRALMDFYIANSFVINAIVLVYALFVYLAHLSYFAAYRTVLEMLGYQSKKSANSQKEKLLRGKMDFDNVDWKAIGRAFWFPFIAAPRALLIRPKSRAVLQKMFNEKTIRELFSSEK